MVRRVLPLILALLAGCASAPPLEVPMPVTVKEPVYVPVYCPVPRLAPPAMAVAGLVPDSPPADTIRAYAATVVTLKGAVTERDAIIAGCAAPAGANDTDGTASGMKATADVGNADAGK